MTQFLKLLVGTVSFSLPEVMLIHSPLDLIELYGGVFPYCLKGIVCTTPLNSVDSGITYFLYQSNGYRHDSAFSFVIGKICSVLMCVICM